MVPGADTLMIRPRVVGQLTPVAPPEYDTFDGQGFPGRIKNRAHTLRLLLHDLMCSDPRARAEALVEASSDVNGSTHPRWTCD